VRHCSLPLAIASVFVVTALAVPHADAQGNGRPKGPKEKSGAPSSPPSTTSPSPSPSPTPTPTPTPTPSVSPTAPASAVTTTIDTQSPTPAPTSVASFRQFGAWLDDASAPTPGEGSVSVGTGYWRMADARQTNMPMIGAGVGLTDSLQVSTSVPFYRVNYQGTTWSGVDDIYIGAKYTLVDPTLTVCECGLAVSPVMEVLSAGALDGRVHFAIPVTVEMRRSPVRAYGSVGYFTRGSVFAGGALEWATPARLVLTGALTQSYSVKADATLDNLAVGRQRVDMAASAAYPIGNTAAAFASIGRSVSSPEEGGTRLALTGGMSFRFATIRSVP